MEENQQNELISDEIFNDLIELTNEYGGPIELTQNSNENINFYSHTNGESMIENGNIIDQNYLKTIEYVEENINLYNQSNGVESIIDNRNIMDQNYLKTTEHFGQNINWYQPNSASMIDNNNVVDERYLFHENKTDELMNNQHEQTAPIEQENVHNPLYLNFNFESNEQNSNSFNQTDISFPYAPYEINSTIENYKFIEFINKNGEVVQATYLVESPAQKCIVPTEGDIFNNDINTEPKTTIKKKSSKYNIKDYANYTDHIDSFHKNPSTLDGTIGNADIKQIIVAKPKQTVLTVNHPLTANKSIDKNDDDKVTTTTSVKSMRKSRKQKLSVLTLNDDDFSFISSVDDNNCVNQIHISPPSNKEIQLLLKTPTTNPNTPCSQMETPVRPAKRLYLQRKSFTMKLTNIFKTNSKETAYFSSDTMSACSDRLSDDDDKEKSFKCFKCKKLFKTRKTLLNHRNGCNLQSSIRIDSINQPSEIISKKPKCNKFPEARVIQKQCRPKKLRMTNKAPITIGNNIQPQELDKNNKKFLKNRMSLRNVDKKDI